MSGPITTSSKSIIEKYMHYVKGMYEYDNPKLLMLGPFPKHHLDQIKELPLSDQDVLICGYPRSGTVWIQQICWLLYNNADLDEANKSPLLVRFPALEHCFPPGNPLNIKNSIETSQSTPPPHLMKTRLPADFYHKQVVDGKTKAIVVMRNPKDMLVSYYHFYIMNRGYGFTKGWDYFFDMFKANQLFVGDWCDHVNSWWALRNQPNVLILKYEDMKLDLRRQIGRINDFCGTNLCDKKLDFITENTCFEAMRDNKMTNFSTTSYVYDFSKAPFMRYGTTGRWREWFSKEQSDYVDDLCRSKLQPNGLTFDYSI